jgi:hypothetical protein
MENVRRKTAIFSYFIFPFPAVAKLQRKICAEACLRRRSFAHPEWDPG